MTMRKSEKDGKGGVEEVDVQGAGSEPDSTEYIARLQYMRKTVDSGTFDAFKRGKISHMRCSPSGRWVVVCHEHACIVYDAEVSGSIFFDEM